MLSLDDKLDEEDEEDEVLSSSGTGMEKKQREHERPKQNINIRLVVVCGVESDGVINNRALLSGSQPRLYWELVRLCDGRETSILTHLISQRLGFIFITLGQASTNPIMQRVSRCPI